MDLFTFPKKALLLFCFLLVIFCQVVHATTYQSTGAGGLWNSAASWSPAGVPNAGDNVTIVNGSPIQIAAPVACATITVNTGAILTMMSSMTVTGSFTVNGTLNCNESFIFGACSFTLANSNTAFLMIGDPGGIVSGVTASGNIENTGGRTFPASANYIYDGIANQNTGSGLPTTINGGGSLTINNTGTAPSNVVTMTAATSSIQNITLQAGNLSLNSKFITVNNGTIISSGGNLSTANSGDGGTFTIQGATLTGPINFDILVANSSPSTITTIGINAPIVDSVFNLYNIASGGHFTGTNSIRYAFGSTLAYQNADGRGVEWNADLTTPATIGVTPGYPYNVTISNGSDFYIVNYYVNGPDGAVPRGLAGNLTTQALTFVDYNPYTGCCGPPINLGSPLLLQTGAFTVGGNMIVNSGGNVHMVYAGAGGPFTIMGSLTINGPSANINMHTMTAPFTVGNGIIMNGGTLNMGYVGTATNIQVTGDIVMNGGTINDSTGTIALTGNWDKTAGTYNALGGTIEFNGAITDQVITDNTPGGENFNNVIINNTAPSGAIGMTYGVNVNGTLTFTKGLFLTYSSADLSIGALGNIVGASQSTGWVARFSGGNLNRTINSTSPYLFPIGNISTYTPVTLTFSSVTAPGVVAMNTPGYNPVSMPGYATYALSKTNYVNWFWYINKLSGTFGSYTADLNYGAASLQGTATVSTVKAGVYDGSTWTYPPSSGTGTTVTATSILPLNGSLENIALAIPVCTPPAIYNVTSTPSCAGATVGVDNSETSVHYQLQTAGPVNVGSPVAGTGSAISFGNQTVGTYTVLATNDTSSCTSNMAGSAMVTASTAPSIVTPAATQNVCFSSAAQTAALPYNTPLNSAVNYTITWDPAAISAGLVNVPSTPLPTLGTDISVPVAVSVTPATYSGSITAINAGGCSGSSNAFTLTINSLPNISGFTAGGACFNSSAQNYSLSYTSTSGAPTSYSITWNSPTSLSNISLTALPPSPISIPVPANASGINTGTINVTDANNCTSAGTGIIVAIYPLPTPTFTNEPGTSACSNSAVTYTTQSGESNYSWTFSGTPGVDYTISSGGTTTDNTVTLVWLTSGNKTVTINYDNVDNCAALSPASSTPTAVTAGPDASNLTIVSTTPVCAAGTSNSTITVNSTTLAADTYKVTYSLGAPNIAAATATMVFSGGTGTFTVPAGNLHAAGTTSIILTGLDNSSCSTGGLSTTNSIIVNTPAAPTFTTQPGASACDHTDIVYATQGGESNYVWSYSGVLNTDYSITSGGSSSDSSVTIQWLISTGSKTVTVDYTNVNNCSAATAVSSAPTKINICNILPLYIPSGFDPNGKNPVWHIQNSEDYPNMQVQIYNRLGQKIFECQGYTAWNGEFQGQDLSAGVYVYVIKVNDERYKQILKGTITLIR